MRTWLLAAFVFCSLNGAALAQTTAAQTTANQPPLTFDVQNMTFATWCQETQQYDAERCAKHLGADENAFEAYRDSFERYEIQYLKQVEQNRETEARTNNDPTQTERARQDAPTPIH